MAIAGVTDGILAQALNYLYPFWTGAWGAIEFAGFLMAGLLLFELCWPGRRLHWKTLLFNTLYIPVYLTLATALLHPLSSAIDPWLPKHLLGIRLTTASPWYAAAGFLLYAFVFDFFYYWFHRAQHGWSVLWRYHTVHHSDVNVSMSTSVRHHWGEEAMRYFVITAPMLIIFGGPEQIPFWMLATIGMFGLFIHWNMPWRLGFLGRWVVTPWYHRIHHSVEARHFDKNFAVFFPFWDWVFGTQHVPAPSEYPDTGMAEIQNPNNLGLLLPWPKPVFVPAPAAASAPSPKASTGDRAVNAPP